jgi:hypothetical protein
MTTTIQLMLVVTLRYRIQREKGTFVCLRSRGEKKRNEIGGDGTHMELGRREVGDVVVDGDLDDALDGHDGGGAHVVRRRRDGPGVPVPLRVLQESIPRFITIQHAQGEREAESNKKMERGAGTYGEVGGHPERAERASALGDRHAHAGERQRVERPVGGRVALGAGVLQPPAGGGGHPRGRFRRAGHASNAGASDGIASGAFDGTTRLLSYSLPSSSVLILKLYLTIYFI